MPEGRRARGNQAGRGRFGRPQFERFNLARFDGDPAGFLRIEDTPTQRPFSYAPALPAIGMDSHINLFQFNSLYDVDTTNKWTQVNSGAGTALTVQDARGGLAMITTNTAEDTYYGYFSKYEIAKIAAGKGLWMDGFVTIADADQADWFFGLCVYGASAALFDTRVDAVGFYGADGSANINCEARKNSTATQSTAKGTLVDATQKRLTIHCNGTSNVHFYIDDGYVATIATNLPDDEELSVAFGIRSGRADSVASTLTLGRILLIQDI